MRLLLAAVLGGTLLVALGSCAQEDESGACRGTMDGRYFRLQMFNIDKDAPLEVRVNGRFIGSVPPASQSGVWGEKSLGIFPVCDKIVIGTQGDESEGSNEICSSAVYLSQACVAAWTQDYCWESFAFFVVGNEPSDDELVQNVSRYVSPQCRGPAVLTSTVDGLTFTRNPANACTPSWGTCS